MAEWKGAVVDLADDITTISSKPALVKGAYVNTVLSAHACPIEDGTSGKLVLKASLAAGTLVEIPATQFETSLIVDPDNSATGNITVFWKDLR